VAAAMLEKTAHSPGSVKQIRVGCRSAPFLIRSTTSDEIQHAGSLCLEFSLKTFCAPFIPQGSGRNVYAGRVGAAPGV